MAGMRDKLIHAYFGIIWRTIQNDIPALMAPIQDIHDDLREKETPAGCSSDLPE